MNKQTLRLLRQRQQQLAAISEQLEAVLLFDECVTLAYFERTGLELAPGAEYTEADATRARELMKLYPGNEK